MNRLFRSLSSTNDGAFVIDENHRIIYWNRAAERILNHTAEEAIGRFCFEILGGRDEQGTTLCQRFCNIALRAESGDVLPNTDVFAQRRAGEGRWLNVTTFVYPVEGEVIGQVIVHLFRDATEKVDNQRFVDQVLAASENLGKDDHSQVSSTPASAIHPNGLTEREREVLALMAQGLGTNEMANSLILSQATVRNHVQNILSKMGVHSRLQAVAAAYQRGLLAS